MVLVMFPQYPLPDSCAELSPRYVVVFIGGFCDVVFGVMARLGNEFGGFLPGVPFVKAYYHWDGDGAGVFWDCSSRILSDIQLFRERYPSLPLVIVGHSYGGSCALHLCHSLSSSSAPIALVTNDPVARRQSPRRPNSVDWWANCFLSEGGGVLDVVPRIGGRWGFCSQADVNLDFSGYAYDSSGKLFSHDRPAPMFFENPDSSLGGLFDATAQWLKRVLE